MNFDENFWSKKYKAGKTGWDLGEVSPPIKNYFNQVEDKEIKILIPGAGNSYEAEYLFAKGFSNITIADIAKVPLLNIKDRLPNFPSHKLVHSNFFDLQDSFDIIVEQTFFCALAPDLRMQYVKKMHALLKPKGKLIGLLFNRALNLDHPPFGGSKEEYKNLFERYFTFKTLENCINSIESRAGMELFINFVKK